MKLIDRVIVITGASSGIGKATALAVGKQGASVILAARRKDRLEEVAAQIQKEGGKSIVIPADVSEPLDVERMIETAIQTFHRIDVLINNAGTGLFAKVEETSKDQMERLWRTNFMGTFYAIRAVLPFMKKQGSGHIVTVCSMAGKRGIPMGGAYSATKFAQAGLMESLRMELRNSPIRTTVIFPGATKSEFTSVMENPGGREIKHALQAQDANEVAKAILQRIQDPKAEAILQPFGRILSILNATSPQFVDWVVGTFVKKKL